MENSSVIQIKVVPGSSRNEVAGCQEGVWRVKIQSPAQDGKANKALVAFLAKKLGLKKRDIAILSGEKSREKRLQITGLPESEIRHQLSL